MSSITPYLENSKTSTSVTKTKWRNPSDLSSSTKKLKVVKWPRSLLCAGSTWIWSMKIARPSPNCNSTNSNWEASRTLSGIYTPNNRSTTPCKQALLSTHFASPPHHRRWSHCWITRASSLSFFSILVPIWDYSCRSTRKVWKPLTSRFGRSTL